MKKSRFLLAVGMLLAGSAVWLWPRSWACSQDFLAEIRMPAGFEIALFADGVDGARSLTLGERGTVFVGTRTAGKVYALETAGAPNRAGRLHVIAQGLNMPNGVAFRDGSLFVAEINRILRYDGIESRLDNPPRPTVLRSDLPADRDHGWKYIAFGPDGLLYVPVGAPCNVCLRQDPRYGSLLTMRRDGSGLAVFASGIRNTVGFDWHPVTRELWFTDNGRDNLGDNLPPDELNRAPMSGLNFGFPYCHGGDIPDPQFGAARPCSDFTPPAQRLDPHVAALGMRFYTGAMFPREYQGQIFIAEHGSWNRTEKIGYRLSLVRLEGSRPISYQPFAEGFLRQGQVRGRPVDLLILGDGSLLVSDDHGGRLYRISYQHPR